MLGWIIVSEKAIDEIEKEYNQMEEKLKIMEQKLEEKSKTFEISLDKIAEALNQCAQKGVIVKKIVLHPYFYEMLIYSINTRHDINTLFKLDVQINDKIWPWYLC